MQAVHGHRGPPRDHAPQRHSHQSAAANTFRVPAARLGQCSGGPGQAEPLPGGGGDQQARADDGQNDELKRFCPVVSVGAAGHGRRQHQYDEGGRQTGQDAP